MELGVPVFQLNDLIMIVIAVLLFVSAVALTWGMWGEKKEKPGEKEWPD